MERARGRRAGHPWPLPNRPGAIRGRAAARRDAARGRALVLSSLRRTRFSRSPASRSRISISDGLNAWFATRCAYCSQSRFSPGREESPLAPASLLVEEVPVFLASCVRLFPQHFGMVAFGFATTSQ